MSKSRHNSRTKQTSTIEIRANTETYLLCMFQRLVSSEPRDFRPSDRMTDWQTGRLPYASADAHRGITSKLAIPAHRKADQSTDDLEMQQNTAYATISSSNPQQHDEYECLQWETAIVNTHTHTHTSNTHTHTLVTHTHTSNTHTIFSNLLSVVERCAWKVVNFKTIHIQQWWSERTAHALPLID